MRLRQSIILLMLAGLAGCASSSNKSKTPYETVGAEPRRDSDVAKQQNALAVGFLEKGDYARAEDALKGALAADIMCGPAHNNLGKVYFHKRDYYHAAWEFQYASKLMPNAAEPANNLGLVFEAAGKLDDATDSYNKAVVLEPENVNALGNLARARSRRGDRDESMRSLLQKLVMRDTRPEWLKWEQETLSRLEAHKPEP
jgi:Tfp pilus assembly protein PilF